MMLSFQDDEDHFVVDEQDRVVLYEMQMEAFRDQECPSLVAVARPIVRSLPRVSMLQE